MPWTKAAELMPPEGEQVLIHDGRRNRMELGRYIKCKWYVEDPQTGALSELAGVTHWAVLLESEANDDSDKD